MTRQRTSSPIQALLYLGAVLITTTNLPSTQAALTAPFLPAETALTARPPLNTRPQSSHNNNNNAAAAAAALLDRRQSTGCIAGTFSCASQGTQFANICCATGQLCTLDSNSQPACCPSGAVCTGTAPGTFATPAATATAASTAPISYVANAFFSFPYITTSFANSAACTNALSQCANNYAACTSDLGGGLTAAAGNGYGYGVTIVVPGATTVVGTAAATVAVTSATSICASLSSVACFGLQSAVCSTVGTAAGGFVVGSANAARPTGMPCVGVLGAVAAGVGLGVML